MQNSTISLHAFEGMINESIKNLASMLNLEVILNQFHHEDFSRKDLGGRALYTASKVITTAGLPSQTYLLEVEENRYRNHSLRLYRGSSDCIRPKPIYTENNTPELEIFASYLGTRVLA